MSDPRRLVLAVVGGVVLGLGPLLWLAYADRPTRMRSDAGWEEELRLRAKLKEGKETVPSLSIRKVLSGADDGHAWLAADDAERLSLCASIDQRTGGGRGARFYYGALQAFYRDSPELLHNRIAEIAALAHFWSSARTGR